MIRRQGPGARGPQFAVARASKSACLLALALVSGVFLAGVLPPFSPCSRVSPRGADCCGGESACTCSSDASCGCRPKMQTDAGSSPAPFAVFLPVAPRPETLSPLLSSCRAGDVRVARVGFLLPEVNAPPPKRAFPPVV